MLNKIIVMGRLGRDPEVRYTSTGKPVASFTLAVDRDFKGPDGRRETDWLQIVAWDAKARFAQQYFHKGQQALVEGRLQVRDWTANDGSKRRACEIVADNIYFAGAKAAQASEGNAEEAMLPPPVQAPMEDMDDGEPVPF